ncbi:MAG: HNH endonuclease [Microcoleus sp. PH2017_25_DOB_D_A]|uniref:HNH endonuclease n=1 Tax=unclassified Microcoleus TaxID=2642155 RepID=UPI001DFF526B|nr:MULTISPECIES: HNH endonuclease [unclassified Microcoleus]MCC3501297.1 HNH endonuclease [Microcoleus sp. PH2017_15_JOR_U_A]MCC3513925.1 HNH endonuclease [Microcoleus sp. PH2017_17_BER_D_A]MCC3538782.1 HNH endonuclease [Microcoleus sp. PH2017_25_DOB_D_A]MCC3551170.1 HNH endonuclease [Microcoleus sp. PH2017_24_DOB_U_A]
MNIITLSLGVDIPYQVNADGCWICLLGKNKAGYAYKNLKGRMQLVHRLVLKDKLGRPIQEKYCACHLCDNPSCINPEHLFEATQKDNIQDAICKQRRTTNNVGKRKLTEEQVKKVREFVKQGQSQYLIAQEFGVNQSTISDIITGKTYKT